MSNNPRSYKLLITLIVACATLLGATPSANAWVTFAGNYSPEPAGPTHVFGFELWHEYLRPNENQRYLFNLNLGTGQSHGSYILEIGGLLNFTTGYTTGIQIAGAINFGTDVMGLQIAGIANLMRKVHGIQIAPLNLTQLVNGLQIGLTSD